MGIEYYLFAAFVFALGAVLVWMIVKGLKKGRAEEDIVWKQREKKLETMYAELSGLLEALETYVEESEVGIARTVRKAEEILHDAGRLPQASAEEEKQEDDIKSVQNGGRHILAAKAVELKRGGRSAQEIAEQLSVSQGEVNLMLRLSSQAGSMQEH